MRETKTIGSSLQAEIEVRAFGETLAQLQSLGDDLRFVLITSQAKVIASSGDTIDVNASVSPHKKCERCWHWREEVGANADHSTLCGRCISNLFGPGEPRTCA